MTNAHQELIDNLIELMDEKGWKQKDLAHWAGISQGTLSTYFTGRAAPNLDALKKMAAAFGVPVSRLMANKEQEDVIVKYRKVPPSRAELAELIYVDLMFLAQVPAPAIELLKRISSRDLWPVLIPAMEGMLIGSEPNEVQPEGSTGGKSPTAFSRRASSATPKPTRTRSRT